MKSKRILLPLVVFGALTLASCSKDLVTNYSKGDLEIDTPWVDYNIPITGIEFSNAEQHVSLERGTSYQYNDYRITPKNATNRELLWKSSDESIATVTNTGYLTGVKGGHTQITVGNEDNTFHPAVLDVDVTVDIESFTVDYGTHDLDWNHEYAPTLALTPSDTTWTNFTYSIPEEEQTIATVEEAGVITTYGENGTVTLTVINEKLGESHKQTIVFDVRDRKIHVGSIDLAVSQGESSRIEIGHISAVKATVTPDDAEDIPTLKYYSRDDSIASVDPSTGIITGKKAGNTKIFAKCEGVESNDVDIEVYEVYATSIEITNAGPIVIDALDENPTQITVNVGVSEQGATKPTLATPTFSSSDDDVVAVGEDGVLTVKQSGSAVITASIQGQSTVYSDTITVNAKAYVTDISFSGPVNAYTDETPTITAILTPASVEDSTVTWSVNPANKVETVINGNQITLTPLEEGPVTLTATSARLGVSKTHTISFSERKVEFERGNIYLVGNRAFNTRTALPGDSWNNAKYAYQLVESPSAEEYIAKQWLADVYLTAGTQFKLRDGPTNDDFKNDYQHAGAIDGTHMRQSGTDNVYVLLDGHYNIYYKQLVEGGYEIYVGIGSTIHFDKSEFTMGLTSTKIYLHDYDQAVVSCVSSNPSVATVSAGTFVENKGMEYTVTGVATGTAVITATDQAGQTATATVHVDSGATGIKTSIYLNTNDIFNQAGAVPFVCAFTGEDSEEIQMTLVEGQTMIYTAEISDSHKNVVFVRMPEGSTSIDWDKMWNQTKDEDAVYGDNNMFTITGYDAEDGKYMTGYWGIFDSEQEYKVPAEFYLAGDFNGWTKYDEDYALTKVSDSPRTYVLNDVYLQKDQGVKVHDKDVASVPAEEEGQHWYSNASEYDNCHYTLSTDGYNNMMMDETATYDITFYPDSEYANTITFAYAGEEPEPQEYNFDFYIIGIGGNEQISDLYGMTKDTDTHYYLANVDLAVDDEIKANNPTTGERLGVTSAYQGDLWEVGTNGNLKVLVAGNYTIDLYTDGTDGNCLGISPTVTPDPTIPEYTATIKIDPVLATWSPAVSDVSLYVWTDDGTKPLGTWEECKGNLDSGTVTLTATKKVNHFILYFTQDGNTLQTANLTCDLHETGNYIIDISEHSWEDGKMTGVTIHVDEGGGETPVVTTADYYLKGAFNSWNQEEAYKFSATSDPNKFTLENVTIHAGEGMKGYKPASGDDAEAWYGVAKEYANCGWTVDNREGHVGDCLVSADGIYTVDLYLVDDYGDDNHLVITKTGDIPGGDTPVEFDDSKVTKVTVINQTGNEQFTSYGVDIKLHIFDITWAENSPITSVAGLQAAGVTIGASTTYNTTLNEIEVTMTWVSNEPVTYTATLPANIESCKICVYNTTNIWVHQVLIDQPGTPVAENSYEFTTSRNHEYELYLCNWGDPSYNAWVNGDSFNTPLSLVTKNQGE